MGIVGLQVAKAVSMALNGCVNCLPGQRDIDNVLKSIGNSQAILNSTEFPSAAGRSYAELQDSLVGSAGKNRSSQCCSLPSFLTPGTRISCPCLCAGFLYVPNFWAF